MDIQFGMCVPDVCQDLDAWISNIYLYHELGLTVDQAKNSIQITVQSLTEDTKHTKIDDIYLPKSEYMPEWMWFENSPQVAKGIM